MSQQKPIGVGIIGSGKRGAGLGMLHAQVYPETGFQVVALCDRNVERMQFAAKRIGLAYADHGATVEPVVYEDYNQLIADPRVQQLMVTSPSYMHREHAVAAIRSGKKVYLDKPLAHTVEDAMAIAEAERATGNTVILGFTRRYERPWRKAYELLQEGAIGDLSMMLLRAVIPYWGYFHRWHRERRWSGGALNDKSSHHFDVFNWFAGSGARAEAVHAFGGVKVFLPDDSAPERCSECDRECPYRREENVAPVSQDKLEAFKADPSWLREAEVQFRRDTCVYRPGADIYDHGSIHFRYGSGIVATLFYSFFGPRADDEETFELVGTKGRLIVKRHVGEIDLIGDHGTRREVIDCKCDEFETSHFGADLHLMRQMRAFFDGTPPVVGVPEGLEATRMVIAALMSMDDGGRVVRMQEIPNVSL